MIETSKKLQSWSQNNNDACSVWFEFYVFSTSYLCVNNKINALRCEGVHQWLDKIKEMNQSRNTAEAH